MNDIDIYADTMENAPQMRQQFVKNEPQDSSYQGNGNQHQNQHNQQNRPNDGTKKYPLYIGNLTWWTSDEDIFTALRSISAGDVHDIKFFENRANGQSKGFCLVVFDTEVSAKSVLEKFPQMQIHEITPEVKWANKAHLQYFNDKASANQPQRTKSDKVAYRAGPNNDPNQQHQQMGNNPQGQMPMPPPGNMGPNGPGGPNGPPGGPNPAQMAQMMMMSQMPPQMRAFMAGGGNPMMRPPPPMMPPQMNQQPPNPQQMMPNPNQPPPTPQQQQQMVRGPYPPMMNQMPGGLTQQMASQQQMMGMPVPPQAQPQAGGPPAPQPGLQINDQEFEEILERNKNVSTSAISRAVQDATQGDYSSAIETLVTAISLIKQSKISNDERCILLTTSLQQALKGIEDRSYGGESSNSSSHRRSRSRGDRKHSRRSRSRSYERYDRRSSQEYSRSSRRR